MRVARTLGHMPTAHSVPGHAVLGGLRAAHPLPPLCFQKPVKTALAPSRPASGPCRLRKCKQGVPFQEPSGAGSRQTPRARNSGDSWALLLLKHGGPPSLGGSQSSGQVPLTSPRRPTLTLSFFAFASSSKEIRAKEIEGRWSVRGSCPAPGFFSSLPSASGLPPVPTARRALRPHEPAAALLSPSSLSVFTRILRKHILPWLQGSGERKADDKERVRERAPPLPPGSPRGKD